MWELAERCSCELNAVPLPTGKILPPPSNTVVRRRGVTHVYLDVVTEGTVSFTDWLLLFSRLSNVSTSSCALFAIMLSFSSNCFYQPNLLPLIDHRCKLSVFLWTYNKYSEIISGTARDENEICDILGFYAAQNGSFVATFRDNPFSRVKQSNYFSLSRNVGTELPF